MDQRDHNDAAVTAEEIAFEVIEPRMAQVAKDKGKPFELHAFQHLAGKQGPRALLRAACGIGKTMAAWKWAETQARTRDRPGHLSVSDPGDGDRGLSGLCGMGAGEATPR